MENIPQGWPTARVELLLTCFPSLRKEEDNHARPRGGEQVHGPEPERRVPFTQPFYFYFFGVAPGCNKNRFNSFRPGTWRYLMTFLKKNQGLRNKWVVMAPAVKTFLKVLNFKNMYILASYQSPYGIRGGQRWKSRTDFAYKSSLAVLG